MTTKVSRKLSVHLEHEVLLKLEAAGFNDPIAQRVVDSKDNKLAKEIVALARGGTKEKAFSSIDKAQQIVEQAGGVFYGYPQWRKQFGGKANFPGMPEIRWSEDELRTPGIDQPHFLWLGNDILGGKPLDLPVLHKFCPGPKHPKFCSSWELDPRQTFARKTCNLCWYFMPIGIVKGSQGKLYGRQVADLHPSYNVPMAVERALANILFKFLTGNYLDEGYWARTADESYCGSRVDVRGYSDRGLVVDDWDDDAYDYIGVSASRKF